MAQYARPDADMVDGGFTPSTGTDLYACLDNNSDTDYISSQSAADDSCQVSLGTVTDPVSSSGHVIRARMRRSKAVSSYNATVTLKQGSTTIATLSVSGVDSSVTTYSYTLSGGEADSITDYSDLNLTLAADYVSGSGSYLLCSWLEVEVPDAAGATYDEATTLTRSAGVSDGGVISLAGVATLARSAGVAELGPVTMIGAATLTRQAGVSEAGGMVFEDGVTIGRSARIGG